MALENLISVTFTEAELTQMDEALALLEAVLKSKTINLTPEQRKQYGSIAEQNKLFVNKAKGYMEQYPQYVPPFLDKAEYDRDYEARQQLETRMQRLASITEQLSDTKTLLDFDNYHNSITFYRNIRYLSGENVAGTTVVYKDMKQFFVTKPSNPVSSGASTPTSGTRETS